MIRIGFENRGYKDFENPVKIKELIDEKDYTYFACKVNNKLKDFDYTISETSNIKFVGLKDSDASKVYECSLRFVLLMAAYRVNKELSLIASFNISRSTLFRDKTGAPISHEVFLKIKEEMASIVKADYKFERQTVTKNEATEMYNSFGFIDKLGFIKYRPEDEVHI